MALKSCPRLVLATANRGKVAEFLSFFQNSAIELLCLADLADPPIIMETGKSFEENAILKARVIADRYNMPALADDSGLLVPALEGAPGVFSSRYGNDIPLLPGETEDGRNIRKLLDNLSDKAGAQRNAYFKAVLAVARPDGRTLTASGEWHGEILRQPKGTNGFGYDSVFYDPCLGKSAAELSREEKIAVSHRGVAIKNLLPVLSAFLTGTC